MKVKNNKGFTLAELLIVMAIVVVLAAVAVPTFGRQMETSRETSDMEVVRNCYEEVLTVAMRDSLDGKLDGKDGKDASNNDISVTANYPGIVYATVDGQATQGQYTVTLSSLASKPKMAQSDGGWQYVKGVLFGIDVAPVVDSTDYKNITYNTKKLVFTFDIPATGDANKLGTLKLLSIYALDS